MRRFPANDTGVYPTPKDPKTPGFAFVAILSLAFQLIDQIKRAGGVHHHHRVRWLPRRFLGVWMAGR